MKEEKTKSRKKVLYYVLIAVSVLLLAAAIVLTVYFTTGAPNDIAETPGDNQGTLPGDDETPGGDEDDDQEEPDEPTGGETEQYVLPVAAESCSVEHNAIYANAAIGMYYRHSGVDFAAEAGAEVYAMADGVVKTVSLSEQLGNQIGRAHV